jgi:ubiquinone/menaquinone biosynthesis C-methylase UbiE
MDYDQTQLPEQYDRARHANPVSIALWLDTVARAWSGLTVRRVLDLGCGTGRYSVPLAQRFAAAVIAVDPSQRMLAQARAKATSPALSYLLGDAEAIPVPAAHVDAVFISMAFHHFRDRHAAARECARVLREPGRVFVRNPTRERGDDVANLRFFPGARALFEERIPTRAEIQAAFAHAGFALREQGAVETETDPSWQAYAERVVLKGDSILASLPGAAFELGVQRVRAFAATAPHEPVREALDYFVFERDV